MLITKNNTILLIVIQFIAMGAIEMNAPFWPIHIAHLLGKDLSGIVMLSTLVYLAPALATMLFTPYWGKLGDKVGHKAMILRSLLALIISQGLFYFVTNIWLILLIRILQGAFSGFIACAQAYAVSNCSAQSRNKVLSYLQAATASGSLIGPLFGGLIMDSYGFGIICLISSCLCLICLIAALCLPMLKNKIKLHALPIKQHHPVKHIIVLIILVQAAKAIPLSFFSLYIIQTFNLSNLIIGVIYSSSAITLAISAPLWGKFFSAKAITKKIFYIEAITWLCTLTLMISSITSNWLIFTFCRMLWGVWQGALLPVIYTLMIANCPKNNYGRYLAKGNSASKAGILTGTLLGGVIISLTGIAYGFWFVSLIYAITGFYIRHLRQANHSRGLL